MYGERYSFFAFFFLLCFCTPYSILNILCNAYYVYYAIEATKLNCVKCIFNYLISFFSVYPPSPSPCPCQRKILVDAIYLPFWFKKTPMIQKNVLKLFVLSWDTKSFLVFDTLTRFQHKQNALEGLVWQIYKKPFFHINIFYSSFPLPGKFLYSCSVYNFDEIMSLSLSAVVFTCKCFLWEH